MNPNNMMSFTDVGSGFPLLMGHSYLFDRSMWTPQTEKLAKKYRLILPDLWGHGNSPALPASATSLNALAEDHLTLMDSLGIDKFAVVGLSVGGMWAAELAALAPERVNALMLFDTFIGKETAQKEAQYLEMLNAVNFTGAIKPPLLNYIVSQFYSDQAAADDVSLLTEKLAALPTPLLRESIVPIGKMIFGRPDRLPLLKSIRCPVCIATGEYDLPRPPEEGRKMAEMLGCEFHLISQAGHISNRENPDAVTRLIETFLNRALG